MAARTAGRSTRRWREVIRPGVLNGSDVCWWCGHPGANAVDHLTPISVAPELAESPDNLAPIHGREGCPICPPRAGRRRVCNNEKGNRINAVAPTPGSRAW